MLLNYLGSPIIKFTMAENLFTILGKRALVHQKKSKCFLCYTLKYEDQVSL